MKKENPGILLALIVLLILEIGVIMLYDQKYFREYTDAIVILTMVVAAYFAYYYLKAAQSVPKRGTKLAANL